MANAFLCTQCGWQETDHRSVVKFTDEEIQERGQCLPGYKKPLFGWVNNLPDCKGYNAPREEIDLYKKRPELIPNYHISEPLGADSY